MTTISVGQALLVLIDKKTGRSFFSQEIVFNGSFRRKRNETD